MARYGRDYGNRGGGYGRSYGAGRFDRGYDLEYGGGRYAEPGGGDYYGGGGSYRETGYGAYGGMRSGRRDVDWSEFPGEGGWFGPGYEGYPSGGYARPYTGGRTAGRQRGGWGGQRNRQGRRGGRGGQRAARRVRAGDIMTGEPETVTPDATLQTVAEDMRDRNVGIIPVLEGEDSERLAGVITDRDIAVRAVAEGKGGKTKVSSVMSEDVDTVNQNDHVSDVLNIMKRSKVRRVPVTDREGRLVGIIAQADLAVDFAGHRRGREVQAEEAIEQISEPGHPSGRGGTPARA